MSQRVDQTDAHPGSPETSDVKIKEYPKSGGILNLIPEYRMDHPRRGLAVIINNREFNEMLTGQKERIGTDIDADALEEMFATLGFEVRRHDNLTTTDMSIKLRMAADENHSDADCFVCAILSHGEEGEIYSKNGKLKLESITRKFKGDICPTLAGKPKIFFVQACRGRRFDFGTEVSVEETDAGPDDEIQVRKIPTEADFLMAYSVVPGHFSWRNSVDGSWFIQALVRVLREHGTTMELMQMMTFVNQIVAYEFHSCTDSSFTDNMKQVPCMVSMLTRQVFFRPKPK